MAEPTSGPGWRNQGGQSGARSWSWRLRSARVRGKRRFLGGLELLEDRRVPTTFTVTSLADNNLGTGNSGDLRYVIDRANALQTGTLQAPDLIQFSGVTLSPGDHTIHVGAGAAGRQPLPALRDPVVIDGTTAGGFNNLTGLMLTLDGRGLRGRASGLVLLGGGATVEALQIVGFPGNGIWVRSSNNTIGGDVVGVNAFGQTNNPAGRLTAQVPPGPTTPVFVRPPLGNVIGGNGGDGVLISNGANGNLLEGNFIGTDVTGSRAQGNGGDGVAIVNSSSNSLLGTTPPDKNDPFVFYNVISGNRGNGLVIDNSNATTVYANFFGLGADNATPLGNRLDGVLIEGTSDQTIFGANIPLGNVSSANGKNGVEVKDSASRTLLMNTFGGVAAFNPTVQVGNRGDGIVVTSNGGGRVFGTSQFSTIILTCQISGNVHDGIELGCKAVGVQVSQSAIGLQTNGVFAAPNGANGIEIHSAASRVAIGGFLPSVAGVAQGNNFREAAGVISGNLGNGIAIDGPTHGVRIVNTWIGTDLKGILPVPNGRNGILIDGGVGIQTGPPLGAVAQQDRNIIAFNSLSGVLVRNGAGDSILGSSIYGNGLRGIRLVHGANGRQPAPVLTSAVAVGGVTHVTGNLTARPSTAYQVEIFASPNDQPGNGRNFLGFGQVTTDAAGRASFVLTLPANASLSGTTFLTATATDARGNTSEFSQPLEAGPGFSAG